MNAKYFLWASENYVNYPGLLSLDGNFKPYEEKSYIAMWAIMQSPFFIYTDLNTLREETLKLLKNETLLTVQSDEYEPGRLIADDGQTLIFRK